MATSYGSLTSFTFTSIRGATDTTWDQSEAVDTSNADAILIYPNIIAGASAAASAGHYVDMYMSMGPSTTRMSGGWAGGDNSYDPVAGDPATIAAKGLTFLGRIPYGDSGSSATEYDATFRVPGPLPQYVAMVSFNSGITLSTDTDVQVTYQVVNYSS